MGCAPLPLTPRPPGRVPWGRELEEKVEKLEEKLAKEKHKAKCGATRPHAHTGGCLSVFKAAKHTVLSRAQEGQEEARQDPREVPGARRVRPAPAPLPPASMWRNAQRRSLPTHSMHSRSSMPAAT